jgi:hypothetical protein
MIYFFFGTILGFIVAILCLSLFRSARIAELEALADYWRIVAEDVAGIRIKKENKSKNKEG